MELFCPVFALSFVSISCAMPPQNRYVHQTIVEHPDAGIVIHDILYSEVHVTEPVLVELVRSPAIQRLAGVLQHGITGLIGFTVPITRLEHSVGAMLLVRHLGASIEEQASALLHDVSHTALSHVVDHAFPGQGSYHEVHKDRYLQTTTIPNILGAHGFEWRHTTHKEAFPLLERDSPHFAPTDLTMAFVTASPLESSHRSLLVESLQISWRSPLLIIHNVTLPCAPHR